MDKFIFVFVFIFHATYQIMLGMNVLYMDELCSASTKSTDVYSRIRLKLTRHDIYLPKFRCQVTLKTNPGDYIWIKFKELNIESICKNDWLELADGPSRSYPYIAGSKFCGYNTPTGIYKTNGNFLTVYFESDSSIEGTGFDIIVEPSVSKYMDNYCQRTIGIEDIDQIRLKLTKNQTYQPHLSCRVTIVTQFRKRMMLYFRDLRIEGSGDCYNDWLEIHDGSSDTHPHLAGGRLCGRSTPSGVYKSRGRYITLYFESDSIVQDTGFDMVITAFASGFCDVWHGFRCENDRCINASLICNGYNSCGDYSDCTTRRCRNDEYKCRNGRCIPSNLTCNGLNPCGDFSDCMTTISTRSTRVIYFSPADGSSMSVGTIIGIAVSCIVILAFLIMGITAYCIKKSRYRNQSRSEPEVTTVNSPDQMRYAYSNPLLYSDPPPPYPGITNSTFTNQLAPPPYMADPLINQETRLPYPSSSTTPIVNQGTQSAYQNTIAPLSMNHGPRTSFSANNAAQASNQGITMPVCPSICASAVVNQASPPPYPGFNILPAENQETVSSYSDITAMTWATEETLPAYQDSSASAGENQLTTPSYTEEPTRSATNCEALSTYPITVAAPTANQGANHVYPGITCSIATNQVPTCPNPGIIATTQGTLSPDTKTFAEASKNQGLLPQCSSSTALLVTDQEGLPSDPGDIVNNVINQKSTNVAESNQPSDISDC